MSTSIIWGLFLILGIIYYIFTGNISELNDQIFSSTKQALELAFQMLPVMALWLGIMNIARISGLLTKLSLKISPLLSKIFPEIPKSHESLGLMASNMIMNLFGLGNAATPFGLKAMKSLESLNKDSKVASNSMITFLVLNTSGLTLVPTTVIALRMYYNSENPTSIVLACILSTVISTIIGLIIDRFFQRRKKYD